MGRFIKISSTDDFQNKFIGTWAVEKYFQFLGLLTWACQMISTLSAIKEDKMECRNKRSHLISSSKWILFALPVLYWASKTLLRSCQEK
jgi:hypothetical protein